MVSDLWGQEEKAKLSADAAGDRTTDIYMGVDVFGRGTFGGGGFDVGFTLRIGFVSFKIDSLQSWNV